MTKPIKVAVLGAGNMGTALAELVARNGYPVWLWNYEGEQGPLAQIKKTRENKKYLPGLKLSKNILSETGLRAAVSGADVVVFAVPSNFVESVMKRAAVFLKNKAVCVDASKGLDEKTLSLVPEVMGRNLAGKKKILLASISGPAFAGEMALGKFTAMNLASSSPAAVKLVKKVLESRHLKLLPTNDLVGVEISGSFKNVYAIAMGICDGLRVGMNTKAALLVLALREIGELVRCAGGRKETVYGLSGLGDLVGTGLCAASRNRRFGELLAKSRSRARAYRSSGRTVEGIKASRVLHLLGRKCRASMPFAEMIYGVVWSGRGPKKELDKFLRSYK